MGRLFIIGAGGFGREVYSWLRQMPEWGKAWHFTGFLDDNPYALAGHDFPAGIAGGTATFMPQTGDQMVGAIGQARARLEICRSLRSRGVVFPIIKHPSAVIGENCRIGEGCVVCPGAVLTTNVTLGSFVVVNVHSSIGHDAVIGDGTTLSGHVDITGFVKIGEGVLLGSHASVLPRAQVGDYATIGAGSVVLRSVKPGATVMGVPAKQISP